MRDKILVSACLLGMPCRYDASSKPVESVIRLASKYELVPVCPEQLGGLSTPRLPCEICGERVLRSDGEDLSTFYQEGAWKTLQIAKENQVKFAILKEKSPSCGSKLRYDGTFSKKLVSKPGITTKLLQENQIHVISEEEIENAR